jgi:hypothetical protein
MMEFWQGLILLSCHQPIEEVLVLGAAFGS